MWSSGSRISSIVFDLDGTLYTCAELADAIEAAAVRQVADSRGISPARARSVMAAAHNRLEEELGRPPTLTRTCEALGLLPRELHRGMQERVHPERWLSHDPVLVALLESLAASCDLYLYTNNSLPLTRKILALLGVDGLFRRLYTIEFTWTPKPDPEALRRVLEDIGGPAEDFLFVGDRQAVDLELPHRLGIRTLLVRETPDLLLVHQLLGIIP